MVPATSSMRVGSAGNADWWLAQPDEVVCRTGHVVEIADRRFAVEPVDHPELDAFLEDAGGIDGVIVLMDRHSRDARPLADRHGVDVYVPESMSRIAAKVTGTAAPLDPILEATDVSAIPVVERRRWQEVALWFEDDPTLYVPEALGTASRFTTADERIGVHQLLRPWPPRGALGDRSPERVLCGHGPPITDGATEALQEALRLARRRLPRAWAEGALTWIRG